MILRKERKEYKQKVAEILSIWLWCTVSRRASPKTWNHIGQGRSIAPCRCSVWML